MLTTPNAKDTSGNLIMEATARTYRYLDAEEIQAMRKASEKTTKKPGAKK